MESPTLPDNSAVLGSPAPKPPGEARVLVVEDDFHTRKILERRLKKQGYHVETAEDGAIGWEMIERARPDVIISDWMMPNMDGRDLCAKVKGDPNLQTIFFILLTARDAQDDKVGALDAGADEYLVKPCDPNELMARVRAAVRIVALQRSLEEKNVALCSAMQRIHHELEVTSEIQRALLPRKLLSVPGYSFAAYYRPSTECSGDYYDLLDMGEGRFGMIMADVSGHGTPAMVAMALARSLVHLFADEAESAGGLLTRINKLLYDHLPTNQFMTSFFGICEAETGRIQYSSAGHNPPLHLSRDGNASEYLANCEGFPLKLVSPDVDYKNHEIRLEPGESLLLYTDGIPEACNHYNDLFDPERLAEAAVARGSSTPEGLLEEIIERLVEFTQGVPFRDDVTMLLISRDG